MDSSFKAILIMPKSVAQIAQQQGALASVANFFAPTTVGTKVLDEMVKSIEHDLKSAKIDATVSIVEPSAWTTALRQPSLWRDVGIGVGAFCVTGILWKIFGGSK